MTSKSVRLKTILKWAAALIGVGGLVVLGLFAWGLGVRWPTVHRVDQPGIPEYLHIKAVDFLDDSGYVVDVSFRTCCTDRLICKRSGSGYTFEEIQIRIHHDHAFVSIPLRWQDKTICPYQFHSVRLTAWGKTDNISYSFFVDSTLPEAPRMLNGSCLAYKHPSIGFGAQGDGPPPDSCLRNTIYRFPAENDTIYIVGSTK